MAKTILVVLKPENNISLLLRRLESIVTPGNRIVFLLRTRSDMSMLLLAQIASLQTGFENGLAWQEQRMRLSWEEQKTWAEENVAKPVRRAFSRMGLEVEVDLYWRSLNCVLKRYLENGEISLILVGTSSWLDRLKIVPISLRNWFVRRLPGPLSKKKASETVFSTS
jgi:hypothetical protein